MFARLSRFLKRHPRGVDAAVAIFWILPSLPGGEEPTPAIVPIRIVVIFVACCGALYWRRRYPLHVFGLLAAVTLVLLAAQVADPLPAALLCATYSLAAYTPERRFSIAGITSLLTIGVATQLLLDPTQLPDAIVAALFITVAWVIGDSLRTRRAHRQSLIDRAERAEALRDSRAQQAVSEERTRIARDLHDVVAHSMSLMVVQAGAARRVVHTNPDAAEAAIGSIEEVGRNSLAEMRRILGLLRGDEGLAELAPQPDIEAIHQLVDEFGAAGLPVEVSISGDPPAVSASLELTVFRIVQESLTNVLKHAGRASATVAITHSTNELRVVVTDDGRGLSPATTNTTGGQRGHVGMRERVAAFGGDFHAGPGSTGGFEVAVSLPTAPDVRTMKESA